MDIRWTGMLAAARAQFIILRWLAVYVRTYLRAFLANCACAARVFSYKVGTLTELNKHARH
jgi:hypothetical protein